MEEVGLEVGPGRDKGTVVKWDDGRGFGFVKPDTGGDVSEAHMKTGRFLPVCVWWCRYNIIS